MKTTLQRAIDFFDSKPSRLAAAVGVSRQTVNGWLSEGLIPADRALDVRDATAGRISVEEILIERRLAKNKAA